MRLIKGLIVLVVMLIAGLGTIVVLVRIIPGNADAWLPLTLIASAIVAAGLITAGAMMKAARRSA